MESKNIGKQKYLKILSRQFKNIEQVSEEIINLQAIINLPKGTELFLSDIHGEYGSFSHILNNGSGIIKNKIEDCFSDKITEPERRSLATLIYYPEEKLALIKKNTKNLEKWYSDALYKLVQVARQVSSKYTRSKVRKALPKSFEYIIDELLNMQQYGEDKEKYYSEIIHSIIELGRADEFIIAISNLIKRMAIDHLHVVGDIYDRGRDGNKVMDVLSKFHNLDMQWGNHDVLWMGAAAGNKSCITNVIRMCARYDSLAILEEGYGINLRPLATFAAEVYKDDKCTSFTPKVQDYNKYLRSDEKVMSRIHKAISIIQFKVEGELIMKHPEYKMEDRLLFEKINYKNGTLEIDGKEYEMKDINFPTVDPKDPYKLTLEEREIINRLVESFVNSEKFQRHIALFYTKGGLYKIYNSNLIFHACVPMEANGEFSVAQVLGKKLSGKAYLDYVNEKIMQSYFNTEKTEETEKMVDFFWYLWCGESSPVFGKKAMKTFERQFLTDKDVKKEPKNPYFKLVQEEKVCNKVLKEFGLDPRKSHIINGHIPVKEKDGESPLKANGKLLVIDGGFAKGYREQTGRAGYALTYNSNGLVLSANEPFDSKASAIREEKDVKYEIVVDETATKRITVADTDVGKELKEQIEGLKLLLEEYRSGKIQETCV